MVERIVEWCARNGFLTFIRRIGHDIERAVQALDGTRSVYAEDPGRSAGSLRPARPPSTTA